MLSTEDNNRVSAAVLNLALGSSFGNSLPVNLQDDNNPVLTFARWPLFSKIKVTGELPSLCFFVVSTYILYLIIVYLFLMLVGTDLFLGVRNRVRICTKITQNNL